MIHVVKRFNRLGDAFDYYNEMKNKPGVVGEPEILMKLMRRKGSIILVVVNFKK